MLQAISNISSTACSLLIVWNIRLCIRNITDWLGALSVSQGHRAISQEGVHQNDDEVNLFLSGELLKNHSQLNNQAAPDSSLKPISTCIIASNFISIIPRVKHKNWFTNCLVFTVQLLMIPISWYSYRGEMEFYWICNMITSIWYLSLLDRPIPWWNPRSSWPNLCMPSMLHVTVMACVLENVQAAI